MLPESSGNWVLYKALNFCLLHCGFGSLQTYTNCGCLSYFLWLGSGACHDSHGPQRHRSFFRWED